MDKGNLYLFQEAINEGFIAKFDEMAANCSDEEIKLNANSVKYLAIKLNKLVDEAALLYLSKEEIPAELTDALGIMWEICSDYIAMYENCSRE